MNESEFGVFIIKYKADNTYGVRAFEQAQAIIAAAGFVEISHGVYVVRLQSSIRVFLELVAQEASRPERRLQFVLLPCGAHTYGELPATTVQELGALGLTHSDTTVPTLQPRR